MSTTKEGQGGWGFVLGLWGAMLIFAAFVVTFLEAAFGSVFRRLE